MTLDWRAVVLRTLLSSLLNAILAVGVEVVYVMIMQLLHHQIIFTSLFSLFGFCLLSGLMPFAASPFGFASRVFFKGRRIDIGIWERCFILVATTILVVLASSFSDRYQHQIHAHTVDVFYFGIGIFSLVLLASFYTNRRLLRRHER
jgi:hypothetical protein